MEQIAILASGRGSNADRLCQLFKHHPSARIHLIACDQETAGVYDIAREHKVRAIHLNLELRKNHDALLKLLQDEGITFIVLAGYLRLIPSTIVNAYPKRIINLHPALLPKFGGKGMHGMHVHEAVSAAQEKETGITIHYVNEKYDEGAIIAQYKVALNSNDTPQQIAGKIAELEAKYFPSCVEEVIRDLGRC
ncbi:MAG: phosphoribosylglycinamide formyltransferase [Bacteroidia bacterium]|jgi:phosphoribosylglycinamide formyltransferase 1|nr:phosphoribosylglycinamide formyltransferase [Bacteroidia bacterium]MBP7245503.1 phosphoribosylglycinamide formyltransferase [Bacteroidia bacterium]